MRRILRYEVPVTDEPTTLELTGGIVHVGARQADTVEFWALEGVWPPAVRTFQVVGTGQPFPHDWQHIGSVITGGGLLVWHLLEVPS